MAILDRTLEEDNCHNIFLEEHQDDDAGDFITQRRAEAARGLLQANTKPINYHAAHTSGRIEMRNVLGSGIDEKNPVFYDQRGCRWKPDSGWESYNRSFEAPDEDRWSRQR